MANYTNNTTHMLCIINDRDMCEFEMSNYSEETNQAYNKNS